MAEYHPRHGPAIVRARGQSSWAEDLEQVAVVDCSWFGGKMRPRLPTIPAYPLFTLCATKYPIPGLLFAFPLTRHDSKWAAYYKTIITYWLIYNCICGTNFVLLHDFNITTYLLLCLLYNSCTWWKSISLRTILSNLLDQCYTFCFLCFTNMNCILHHDNSWVCIAELKRLRNKWHAICFFCFAFVLQFCIVFVSHLFCTWFAFVWSFWCISFVSKFVIALHW